MKKGIILFLLFAMSCSYVWAQEQTLMSEDGDTGVFGGPFIEMSSINGQFGADVGGGGAIMYNGFFLGGYGQGAEFAEFTDMNDQKYDIKFNHGGLWLGYSINRYKVIHPYTSLKIGWGKARLNPQQDGQERITERHFSLLPEAGIELNVNGSMHVVISGGYRIVNGLDGSDVEAAGLSDDDLSGAFGKITFRFGSF